MLKTTLVVCVGFVFPNFAMADDHGHGHRKHGHHHREPVVVEHVYRPAPALQPRYAQMPGTNPSNDRRSTEGLVGGALGSAVGYEISKGDPLGAGLGAAAGAWIGNGIGR
ncbi:glycine zipper 2TM domain-containing protein [Methylomonas sp. MED-D]|nr:MULTISPECIES: hypothetical protein [Methylomonas]MDT4329402.1 hypothetical protein [Methylomonas sp. MV1]OHX38091.1 hypothetical protein BJL95_23050 [Methylomonas sp. LWB]WGS87417.1 hypothetical protein QC632_06590 [Methylomonas sp. UP202]